MVQEKPEMIIESPHTTLEEDDGSCSCNKKQCAIGLSSIIIGVGGFILAYLL